MCSPSVQWLMKHEPMLQQHESMLQNLASTRHPSSSSWFFDRDDQVRELRYDKRSGSRPLRLADGHLRLTTVNHLREHVRRRQTGSPQVKAVAGHLGSILHTLQGVEVPLPGLASVFQRHGYAVFEYSDLSQEVKWLVAGRASCALSVSASVGLLMVAFYYTKTHLGWNGAAVTDNGTAEKSPRTSAVCGDELNNGHDGSDKG